jgi:hypothetical protein
MNLSKNIGPQKLIKIGGFPKLSLFFFLFGFFFFFFVRNINAQTIKDYDCKENPDDYHSLRPAPGDPCYQKYADLSYMCANTMVIKDKIEVSPYSGGSCTYSGTTIKCNFRIPRTIFVSVDPSEAELPIMGNTEDVIPHASDSGEISDLQKINDYLSWYLNGVTNRAEYPPTSTDTKIKYTPILNTFLINVSGLSKNDLDPEAKTIDKLISYSSPINRLLPFNIQIEQRRKIVASAKKYMHNQVVGCTYGIPGFSSIPGPCYQFTGPFSGIFNFLSGRDDKRLTEWANHKPPLSSDSKYKGKDFSSYYIDYRKWRGDFCFEAKIPDGIPYIGGLKFFYCGDNLLAANFWSTLFPNIPFASTEDRKGKILVSKPNPQTGEVEATDITWEKGEGKDWETLYFPHMQEATGLAALLQKTYISKGDKGKGGSSIAAEPPLISPGCTILKTRTNAGDSLMPIEKKATMAKLTYVANFSCTFSTFDLDPSCEKTAVFSTAVAVRTPLVDEAWTRLVSGSSSIFRKIFPKLNSGGLGNIIDFPAQTKATYSVSGDTKDVTPTEAEVYINHVGGISEYFLKGIQTMLRPKGYGENVEFANPKSPSGAVNCNQAASPIEIPGILNREATYQLALNWIGGQTGNKVLECYYDVVNRALAAGIHPGFALIVWLNESNASNYSLSEQDFGINDKSILKNFNKQIERFLGIPGSNVYTSCANESFWSNKMEAFLYMFRTGNCVKAGNDLGKEYYELIQTEWAWENPGCPFPSYPTENTCP